MCVIPAVVENVSEPPKDVSGCHRASGPRLLVLSSSLINNPTTLPNPSDKGQRQQAARVGSGFLVIPESRLSGLVAGTSSQDCMSAPVMRNLESGHSCRGWVAERLYEILGVHIC